MINKFKYILLIFLISYSNSVFSQVKNIEFEKKIIEKIFRKNEIINLNKQKYNLCEISTKKYFENRKLNAKTTFGWLFYGIKNDYLAFHKFTWNEKNNPEEIIRITQIDTLNTETGILEIENWKYENDSILSSYHFASALDNFKETIINKWSLKKDTLKSSFYNSENVLIKEKEYVFLNSKKIKEEIKEYLPKRSRIIISESKFTYNNKGKIIEEYLTKKEIVLYETKLLKNDTIVEKKINHFEFDSENNLIKKYIFQKIDNEIYEDQTITFENKYDDFKNLIETKKFINKKFIGKEVYKYDKKLKTAFMYYDNKNQLIYFDYYNYNKELLESEKYTYYLTNKN